ncbi:STAS domain-containing protein [Janthinobacterium fluminis]|uniref:STAS domain-containing protein n=1 Tax=Janthinobacterium fluminis TaxID=2987524 RepID=A0ABT5K615_9BURK|nr:hypothetical protein [Janthinobacterium fluminis]MDC8760448.1 hypothetical protein [Janthinobacterium fluminis]
MGLFSLFKKNAADAPPQGADEAGRAPNSEANRELAQARQRELARATAQKIDEIEAAMAFDIFNTPEPAWGSAPKRPPRPPAGDATLALLDAASTELLGCAAGPAPVVEEIAVLFANGQLALAGQMLTASLAGAGADRSLWWMLFDLYQIEGRQEQFDSLSIDYASTFETSPPAWSGAPPQPGAAYAGAAPTLALSGPLDGAIGPALERLGQLARQGPLLRLDLSQVTAVEPAGCALLLHSLKQLQDGQRELVVVAAAELAAHIQAIVQVGRRDEGEACWLLLLELLQLLKREKEFEETSMDYCVTFEVSPPPYLAPAKVATPPRQPASAASDRFMLPPLVDGAAAALLDAIDAYAGRDGALVFDCSRLARIEYGAAGLLLARLRRLAADGKAIEFRDLNHLVAALLRLLAFCDIAKIFPHKY